MRSHVKFLISAVLRSRNPYFVRENLFLLKKEMRMMLNRSATHNYLAKTGYLIGSYIDVASDRLKEMFQRSKI